VTTLDLPPIGLGTSGNTEFEECAATVVRALEAGYRHVDTAQMYDNEAAVGEGLRRADVPREDVVLATKVHPESLGREDALRTARESLDRLGVDAVDMLYVHWPTKAYEPAETLAAFDELHRAGVARHVCVSNFTPALLDEARDLLTAPVAAHQVECHPLLPQRELRAYARRHGHTVVGYSPLGRGDLVDHPVLAEVAERHGVPTAAVPLAWARAVGVVPIPKGRGEHVEANLAAVDLSLDDADLDRIARLDERRRYIDPDGAAWNATASADD
jgi:2,5-diketo-D-gluconate reductase B